MCGAALHKTEVTLMNRKLKGFGFLVAGLVLGIVGTVVSVTAVSLSAVGVAKTRKSLQK